jgi:hypothetical protein
MLFRQQFTSQVGLSRPSLQAKERVSRPAHQDCSIIRLVYRVKAALKAVLTADLNKTVKSAQVSYSCTNSIPKTLFVYHGVPQTSTERIPF